MSLVIDLINLVAKHKAGELRCPATALIIVMFILKTDGQLTISVHKSVHRMINWLI